MGQGEQNSDNLNRLTYLFEKDILEDNYDIIWPANSENMDFFPDDLSRYVKAMLTSEDKYKNVAKTGACDDALLLMFKITMKKVVEARLSEYSTSIAQDAKMLERQDLAHRQRMAVEVRLGEKKLLAAASARLSEDDLSQTLVTVVPSRASEHEQFRSNGHSHTNQEPASKKRKTG